MTLRATRAGRVEVLPALLHLREGDRRNAEQEALHRRRDGARIERVLAHVGALVDSGDDEVRALLEQARQRQVDAVGRRSVDVAKAVRGGVDREAAVERQRVRRAARVLLGRDDVEIAEPFARLDERGQPGSEVAVVVGDEDAHGPKIVGSRLCAAALGDRCVSSSGPAPAEDSKGSTCTRGSAKTRPASRRCSGRSCRRPSRRPARCASPSAPRASTSPTCSSSRTSTR